MKHLRKLLHYFIPKFHYFKVFAITNACKKVSLFFSKRWWISKFNSRLSFCYSVPETKKCLKLYLISNIFLYQSCSLVYVFNNPINYCNTELSNVFRILVTNSLNVFLTILPLIARLQSVLITKAEKIFYRIMIWWTSLGFFGILLRAVINWNSSTNWASVFLKSFRHGKLY